MQKLVYTEQGQQWMAELVAENKKVIFSRIETSDFDYSCTDMTKLTDIDNVKQSSEVSDVFIKNDKVVNVKAGIDNAGLVFEYYIRAVGLYAKNEENNEVLFAVAIETETPDHMPSFNNKISAGLTFSFEIVVASSQNISLEAYSGAYATTEQLDCFTSTILDTSSIETAFNSVFQNIPETTDPTAMTESDVETALSFTWNGESSPDPTAMQADDVESALNTNWNGESSSDQEALTADDIEEATT